MAVSEKSGFQKRAIIGHTVAEPAEMAADMVFVSKKEKYAYSHNVRHK